MYRSLIIVALCYVATIEACRPPPCHWSDAKPIEDYYNQVVNVMIAADRKIQEYCQQQSQLVKEDHKPTNYKLIYPADAEAYEIKVKNRAILIRSENCVGSLADVRVLPPYVNPRGAHYSVDQGMLTITFPYKFDPVSGGGVCIPPDPSYVIIPRGAPSSSPCTTDCNSRQW